MENLHKHELFEIEVLDKLNSGKFLESLVFGGGTMLRLCYELNRYSVDLDFWFIKEVDADKYFKDLKNYLSKFYEITDAKIKHFTLSFELRSNNYPNRLKIEIRKEVKHCDFEDRIAFSKYGVKQVILKAHTLEQSMKNKIEAALDRRQIRDCFDIEFLLRRGVKINASKERLDSYLDLLNSFSKNDFKVVLGSLLDKEERDYYAKNGFKFTLQKINI